MTFDKLLVSSNELISTLVQSQWKGASQSLPTNGRQEEAGDDEGEGESEEVGLAAQVGYGQKSRV